MLTLNTNNDVRIRVWLPCSEIFYNLPVISDRSEIKWDQLVQKPQNSLGGIKYCYFLLIVGNGNPPQILRYDYNRNEKIINRKKINELLTQLAHFSSEQIVQSRELQKIKTDIEIELKTDSSIGHATLQTFTGGPEECGIYASLWPADEDKARYLEGVPYFNQERGESKEEIDAAIEKDIEIEERYPDVDITLCKLNVEAINEIYLEFKKSGYKWSLLLGCIPFPLYKTKHCSGLCYDLLVAGGVLVPYPMADFYAHILVIQGAFFPQLQMGLDQTYTKRLSEWGWSYLDGCDASFAGRSCGVVCDLSGINFDNIGENPFLFHFISISFLRIYSKGYRSSIMSVISAFIGIFIHDLLIRKTITPNDIASIAAYVEDTEKNNQRRFLPHYHNKEYGVITRNAINIGFIVAYGITYACKLYLELDATYTTSQKIIAAIWLGSCKALFAWIAYYDPRVPLSAFITSVLFLTLGYSNKNEVGLLNSIFSNVIYICGGDREMHSLFALLPLAIFHLSDKICANLNGKQTKAIKEQNSNFKNDLTLTNVVKTAFFAAVIFFDYSVLKHMLEYSEQLSVYKFSDKPMHEPFANRIFQQENFRGTSIVDTRILASGIISAVLFHQFDYGITVPQFISRVLTSTQHLLGLNENFSWFMLAAPIIYYSSELLIKKIAENNNVVMERQSIQVKRKLKQQPRSSLSNNQQNDNSTGWSKYFYKTATRYISPTSLIQATSVVAALAIGFFSLKNAVSEDGHVCNNGRPDAITSCQLKFK